MPGSWLVFNPVSLARIYLPGKQIAQVRFELISSIYVTQFYYRRYKDGKLTIE